MNSGQRADKVPDKLIVNLGMVVRNLLDFSQLDLTADSLKFFNKRLLLRKV